jgi:hypothetical protein
LRERYNVKPAKPKKEIKVPAKKAKKAVKKKEVKK